MKNLLYLLTLICLISCSPQPKADLIIINADFYTAADSSMIEAIACKGEYIMEIGSKDEIMKLKSENTILIDAEGQFAMPGFIEGHGHFVGMGKSLVNLNFLADTSWQDIVNKVADKVKTLDDGEWVFGFGWHQEKWTVTPENNYGDYPQHEFLSAVSPDNPVILIHASGHSLFANEAAMNQAGINTESPDPKGGHIVRNNQGEAIGVFEERAMKPISEVYSDYLDGLEEAEQSRKWHEAFYMAQEECLRNGITSFQDAGLEYENLEKIEVLAEAKKLDIRFWVMLREKLEDLTEEKIQRFRKINHHGMYYTCRAIKSEIDGALGAHGAWLLEPYNDKKDFYGQNTTEISDVKEIASMCYDNGMQLCVHAIGDRANKETLDIIEDYNNKSEEELRWRVEHAQHLNPGDIQRFKNTGAIASMQGVHCTSDAPFVEKRLGYMRAKIGAYAWKALLDQGVTIVNGTDVPVEKIDPFVNFHASVTRTRLDNGMRFFVEQRMSREQALRSYTIDAAYGAFEEDVKGSLEKGKLADIVILDTNLLSCSDDAIPNTKVLFTIVGGKVKYERKE